MEKSIKFYTEVLGQEVGMNIGNVNVSFGNGLFALQKDFGGLVDAEDFSVGKSCNDHELVFEDEDFDAFLRHLETFPDIQYVHQAKPYPWHQRVVRFYDPDGHVIEVGEQMKSVMLRLKDEGMSVEEIAQTTMHPVEVVELFLNA